MKLQTGAEVPLNLQVFDGREDLTVKVRVIDPQENEIFTGELESVGEGLYLSKEFMMPNQPYVIATYIVFDGKKESEDYERATDIFYLCEEDQTESTVRGLLKEFVPPKDDFLLGHIDQEWDDSTFIQGVLNGIEIEDT